MFHGALPRADRRADLHAIDASSIRWIAGAGLHPVLGDGDTSPFLDAHGAGFNSHPHHAHQPHHKAC